MYTFKHLQLTPLFQHTIDWEINLLLYHKPFTQTIHTRKSSSLFYCFVKFVNKATKIQNPIQNQSSAEPYSFAPFCIIHVPTSRLEFL